MTDIEKLKELEARLRTYALAEDIFGQERRDLEAAADLLASLASKDEEIEILHDAEARWIARLSVLRMHSGDNGKMMLAEFSTWFEKRWNELLAAETSLASKDAEIERQAQALREMTFSRDTWRKVATGRGSDIERETKIARAAEARLAAALAALERLASAKLLSQIRPLVAGWNGENLPPEKRYGRHHAELGVTLRTNTGEVYPIDEAIVEARATLAKLNEIEGNEDD